jgi:1-deoxy-D-xylulose-5-phosphate reductoisomerase
MKRIAVLGSTGSIGRQTLDVVRKNKDKFSVVALTARDNYDLLLEQIIEFKPKMVALLNRDKAKRLKIELQHEDIEVLEGEEGIISCSRDSESDLMVNGLVGISGLIPTLEAIKSGKDIALANKETLVAGGHLVTELAGKWKVKILPVDSEHSAIFQCIGVTPAEQVKKIILTASGGPFRGKKINQLKNVTIKDALKHPNWRMGNKVTIDSATLMNKGLEVIEAKWLFGIEPDKIEVVVHPQSIIHSMVEFVDGALIAQLGSPDMRIPIQYALTYPERMEGGFSTYNPVAAGNLEFYEPDTESFPCLRLAYEALKEGGTMPVVLNGANEIAVESFLAGAIPFVAIPKVVEKVMSKHHSREVPGIDEILHWDKWSRREASSFIEKEGGDRWLL